MDFDRPQLIDRLKAAMAAKQTLSQFQDELKAEGLHMTRMELRLLAAEVDACPPDVAFTPTPVLPPTPSATVTPHGQPVPGMVASGEYRCASGARGQWAVTPQGQLTAKPDLGTAQPLPEEAKLILEQVQRLARGSR